MADTMEESMQDLDPKGAIGEDDIDHAAHEKLLDSIYALDGKKRLRNQVRGAGISSNNLDLLVHTKKESTKIKPTELNLKKKKTNLVAKPLSNLETEKAKRKIARDVMEKDNKKWEPIVHEIRVAPQIKYADRPKGMEMYKAMEPQKFSPRTPLEVELYEALGKSEDIITPDEPLTKAERNALKAMSVKEAMERRKELLMHHELLTRMQVKAKRIKKIKSKRFRRGRRKDKETAEKRKMEELKLSDPEAFLEKMAEVDKARMEERLTLKHKAGGKFARYHKVYSKYDDSAREAVQEMVRKGKELTQKRHIESSDDEEEEVIMTKPLKLKDNADDGDETGKVSDLNSRHLDVLKAINKKAGGWLDGKTKYVFTDNQTATVKDREHGEEQDMAETTEKDNVNDEIGTKKMDTDLNTQSSISKKRKRDDSLSQNDDVEMSSNIKSFDSQSKNSPKKNRPMADAEEKAIDVIPKTPAKRQKIMQQNDNSSPKSSSKKQKSNDAPETTDDVQKSAKKNKKGKKGKQKDTVQEIVLKPTGLEEKDEEKDMLEEDGDEEEEMAVTMEELFEDEDVVEQFARDKAEEEEKRRPKEEDVKLPGWGSWSGPDYKDVKEKAQKTTRRRKFEPKAKTDSQKDKQPNLWLNPNRDVAIRQFQPKRVPFPYVDANQFEAANRQPVSRGFVRETAHKILVKPEVVTKLGHIIKPLDKDNFFKNKDSLDVDESFGKELKYTGPINFKQRDERLITKS